MSYLPFHEAAPPFWPFLLALPFGPTFRPYLSANPFSHPWPLEGDALSRSSWDGLYHHNKTRLSDKMDGQPAWTSLIYRTVFSCCVEIVIAMLLIIQQKVEVDPGSESINDENGS